MLTRKREKEVLDREGGVTVSQELRMSERGKVANLGENFEGWARCFGSEFLL